MERIQQLNHQQAPSTVAVVSVCLALPAEPVDSDVLGVWASVSQLMAVTFSVLIHSCCKKSDQCWKSAASHLWNSCWMGFAWDSGLELCSLRLNLPLKQQRMWCSRINLFLILGLQGKSNCLGHWDDGLKHKILIRYLKFFLLISCLPYVFMP